MEGRQPGGPVRAQQEGNEAVAPPIFAIGIVIESAWSAGPGGLMRASHEGNEAVAPPRLCR